MKKLLLVDSDKESAFALSKQLEFEKKYVAHQAIGYQDLQELKAEKKIADIILINIHKNQHESVDLGQISNSFPNSQLIVLIPDEPFFKGVYQKLDSQKEILLKVYLTTKNYDQAYSRSFLAKNSEVQNMVNSN